MDNDKSLEGTSSESSGSILTHPRMIPVYSILIVLMGFGFLFFLTTRVRVDGGHILLGLALMAVPVVLLILTWKRRERELTIPDVGLEDTSQMSTWEKMNHDLDQNVLEDDIELD